MRRRTVCAVAVYLLLLVACMRSSTAAENIASKPAAVALLRGVESVRLIEAPVRIEAIEEQIAPPPVVDLHYVLEVDGDKMMSNLLDVQQDKMPISDGEVTLLDGREVHFHIRAEHSDVAVSDLDGPGSIRGGFLFDPSVLGLSDILSPKSNVKNSLRYDFAESAEVLGQVDVNGVKAWHVKFGLKDYVYEFWVEEPAFRIHRKDITWPGTHVQIDLRYDADNQSPFPSWIHCKRTINGQVERERIVTIKSFTIGVEFAPDHFTLKGMEIPINTPVVDYRIQRRMGYWDGEGLSEWPIQKAQSIPKVTQENPN